MTDKMLLARIERLEGELERRLAAIEDAMSHREYVKRKAPAKLRRKATAERDQRIKELYESGLSIWQVGAKVGMSGGGALYVLRRLGVKRRPTGGVGRVRRQQVIEAFRASDGNAAAAAATLGVTRERVRQILVEEGIPTQPAGRVVPVERQKRYAEIKRRFEAGETAMISSTDAPMTDPQIAQAVGVIASTVGKALGYTNKASVRAMLHQHGETLQIRAMRQARDRAA